MHFPDFSLISLNFFIWHPVLSAQEVFASDYVNGGWFLLKIDPDLGDG